MAASPERGSVLKGCFFTLLIVTLITVSGCGESDGHRKPARIIGGRGLTSGLFVEPRGIAVAGDGTIFCVDMTGRVQVLSGTGDILSVWMTPSVEKGRPEGLAIDGSGNILVADTHYGRVIKYSPEGKELLVIGGPGEGPGQFVFPLAVAMSPTGDVFVSDYGGREDRVQRFSAEGKFISGWGVRGTAPGEFRRPSGLAIDGDSRVYVADTGNHRVQRFTVEGKFIDCWGSEGTGPGQLSYPYDLALTSDGTVVVCEYQNCRVSEFSREGEFMRWWGGGGSEPGRFAMPWCIASGPGGDVYVSDTRNCRIQVFEGRGD